MNTKKTLEVIQKLADTGSISEVCHEQLHNTPMPSEDTLKEMINLIRSIIFPGYFGDAAVTANSRLYHIGVNIDKLQSLLQSQIKAGLCFESTSDEQVCEDIDHLARKKSIAFISQLPEIRDKLYTDVVAAYNGDPAAKSYGEVIFCYPGIRAISSYRIANTLLKLEVPLIPRIICEMAHSETGIDIHPGASIGSYFTIDHGTGVVIGETAKIGDHVKMYQGVTLGAKVFLWMKTAIPSKE